MKKSAYKIGRHVDPTIKVGNIVTIIDGSGLSPMEEYYKNCYIVDAYPDLTGSDLNLMAIHGEVTNVGISDIVTDMDNNLSSCYGVDITVKLGNAEFYTCSKFVTKIKQNY
jgi:hypothetical protein